MWTSFAQNLKSKNHQCLLHSSFFFFDAEIQVVSMNLNKGEFNHDGWLILWCPEEEHVPVMYAEAGLDKKTAAMAMSHFRPTLFRGIDSFMAASISSGVPGRSFAKPGTQITMSLNLNTIKSRGYSHFWMKSGKAWVRLDQRAPSYFEPASLL